MSLSDAEREMVRLSQAIDERLTFAKEKAREYAACEREYRKAKAAAWATEPREHEDGSKITANERQARVEGATADERYARDLAESMKRVGMEAVQAARQQLSAWQSWLKAEGEEAAFSRTGPR